jgi:glutaredoxin
MSYNQQGTAMQTFTVYSKPNCTYCDQAKALLEAKGVPYQVVNLDVGQPKDDGAVYISRDELLAKIPTARTMPQILKQDANSAMYIGSYQELKSHLHA